MSSFLNSALGSIQQHTQNINQHAVVELRVGSHIVVVKERLAEGGFGFVDLVQDLHSKKEFVLKRCGIDRQEALNIVRKEINILQRYSGPYIVQLIESDIVQKNSHSKEALLLLDYCPGGHLLDRLNKRNGSYLPPETIYRIFGQILVGLKPFHESNPCVVHRDLKLENILFGIDGKVRLCDFGSCVEGYIYIRTASERNAAEEVIQKETTQMYRSPELVDLYMRDVLTEKSDIWALGCILFALCYLVHPFQDAGSLGILSGKYNFPKTSAIPEDAQTLIQRMLDIDPEARPSIQQLLEMVTVLATGNPLPSYELSSEALQRRQDRIAANKVRESKNVVKKVAPAPIQKKVLPLDSSSVAARRLAAKRGGNSALTPGGTTPFSPNNNKIESADIFFANENDGNQSTIADFADFDNTVGEVNRLSNDLVPNFESDQFNSFQAQPYTTFPIITTNDNLFDAFEEGFPSAGSQAVSSAFDPFSTNPSTISFDNASTNQTPMKPPKPSNFAFDDDPSPLRRSVSEPTHHFDHDHSIMSLPSAPSASGSQQDHAALFSIMPEITNNQSVDLFQTDLFTSSVSASSAFTDFNTNENQSQNHDLLFGTIPLPHTNPNQSHSRPVSINKHEMDLFSLNATVTQSPHITSVPITRSTPSVASVGGHSVDLLADLDDFGLTTHKPISTNNRSLLDNDDLLFPADMLTPKPPTTPMTSMTSQTNKGLSDVLSLFDQPPPPSPLTNTGMRMMGMNMNSMDPKVGMMYSTQRRTSGNSTMDNFAMNVNLPYGTPVKSNTFDPNNINSTININSRSAPMIRAQTVSYSTSRDISSSSSAVKNSLSDPFASLNVLPK
eukprot:gene7941-10775_t